MLVHFLTMALGLGHMGITPLRLTLGLHLLIPCMQVHELEHQINLLGDIGAGSGRS